MLLLVHPRRFLAFPAQRPALAGLPSVLLADRGSQFLVLGALRTFLLASSLAASRALPILMQTTLFCDFSPSLLGPAAVSSRQDPPAARRVRSCTDASEIYGNVCTTSSGSDGAEIVSWHYLPKMPLF